MGVGLYLALFLGHHSVACSTLSRRGPGTFFLCEWCHRQGKLCECGHQKNDKQLCLHTCTEVRLYNYSSRKMAAHEGDFFVAHHETVGRTLCTSTCLLPSWPTYPLLGLPTKKLKVHQFQTCCARTKHLSERHKSWSVIVHATAIFSHTDMSWRG